MIIYAVDRAVSATSLKLPRKPSRKKYTKLESKMMRARSINNTAVSLVGSRKLLMCARVPIHLKITRHTNDAADSGAQVGVASFAVNYLVDQGIGIDQSRASNLFSYCQMTFTAGR